eukprot:g3649.t1
MQQLTPTGQNIVNDISSRYNLSFDSTVGMLCAVNRGGGSMAQFSCPELGSGQWMRGGMTMVGDMFNHGLKNTVNNLCGELSNALANNQMFPPAQSGGGSGNNWWPGNLGSPSSSGSQNNVRYAFFPQAQRLVVERNGDITVFNTLNHHISGVSQQQGGNTSLTFTSQFGTISTLNLPLVEGPGLLPAEKPDSTNFAAAVTSAPINPPPVSRSNGQSSSEIMELLENLGKLRDSASVFLKRDGHEVIAFEQAPVCRAVGAGFLLQPSGMEVLRELGVYDEVISHASRVGRLHVMEKDGRDLMELSYRELGGNLFGAGLHRPVVMDSLIGLMEREGVEIRWGRRVESAEKVADGWQVEGEKFDLLLVADGARSAMRRKLLGEGYDKGYGWGAHWFIGKNNGVFPEGDLHQIVCGTRKLAGFLPTGRERAVGPGGGDLVSLFWSIEVARDAEIRSQPLQQWKDQILDLCPAAADLLSQIHGWEQILTARSFLS